jgi:hypothetical protein
MKLLIAKHLAKNIGGLIAVAGIMGASAFV